MNHPQHSWLPRIVQLKGKPSVCIGSSAAHFLHAAGKIEQDDFISDGWFLCGRVGDRTRESLSKGNRRQNL
jgi:hypothetical protein